METYLCLEIEREKKKKENKKEVHFPLFGWRENLKEKKMWE